MDCSEFKSAIDTYLDNELTENSRIVFEEHRQTCEDCHTLLKSWDQNIHLLRETMAEENPPKTLKKKVFNKIDCC